MPIDRAGYRSGTVMHVNVRKDICFPFHALVRVHLCSRSLAMHCIEKRIALRLLQLRFYKKERSSNYFREIMIQSRNFSTRIHYVIDSFRIRLNRDSMRKKRKEEKHGQIDFSLRGNIWTRDLPIYLHLLQTRSDIFSYIIPPLVTINAPVAMEIGRRKISFEGWILIAIG